MNKTLFAIAFAVVVALTATNAGAAIVPLSIGDAFYLGTVNDGIPSNPASEVGYINNLTTLAAGAGNTVIGTETYNRVGSSLPGPFPTAQLAGNVTDNSGNNTIVLSSSFAYVLGKYDAAQAGSLVWLISSVSVGDTLQLPPTFNGLGLSHIGLFNPDPTTRTPDGGATLMMLGSALGVVELLRRRLRA